MELECKNNRASSGEEGGGAAGGGWERKCRQEYGSALYMTPEEKQISFYNRYFIFRKNRNINAKQLKSSFLSYAGLQEQQDRAAAAAGGEDDVAESVALEKIAKASRPMDVASKPAIAAHIIAQREADKQMEAITAAPTAPAASATTLKIKPKPKRTTVKASAATAAAAPAAAEEDVSSAPIAQIEKKIQKRTKKVKLPEGAAGAAAPPVAAAAAADAAAPPAAKRRTKKKTDL
jgi:hypothetical protein